MTQSNQTHRNRAEVSGKRLRPRWSHQGHSRKDTELEDLLTAWADDLREEASKAILPTGVSRVMHIKIQKTEDSSVSAKGKLRKRTNE